MDKLVPEKLDGFLQTRGEAIPFGEHTIVTPRGDVETTDAPGYMTLLVEHSDPEFSRIAFLLYAPGPDMATPGKGMIAQMTADQARNIAASLTKLAEHLAPGSMN